MSATPKPDPTASDLAAAIQAHADAADQAQALNDGMASALAAIDARAALEKQAIFDAIASANQARADARKNMDAAAGVPIKSNAAAPADAKSQETIP